MCIMGSANNKFLKLGTEGRKKLWKNSFIDFWKSVFLMSLILWYRFGETHPITDACVKIAVLAICSEKETTESVVETFKNSCTVEVHFWYIKDAFAGFCQQIFEKKKKNWKAF